MCIFRKLCILLVGMCVGVGIAWGQTPVDMSVHNLSALGSSDRPYISSDPKTATCIFCHAPHNTKGVQPLWNKELPATDPATYTSSTFVQHSNPVSDRSKLCLSCHDGTIALGQTVATGDLGLPAKMTGPNVMGSDLQRDHPISFNLPAQDDGEIAGWLRTAPIATPDPAVDVYDNKVECRSCHDPHVPDYDKQAKKFLVKSNESGALCLTCHDQNRGVMANWADSEHATAVNQPTSAALHYKTVGQNACMSCHVSHNAAGTGPRLLRGVASETCATCHSSTSMVTPAPVDVMSVVNNAGNFSHIQPSTSDTHDPAETLPVSTRHLQCADCHNPHASKKSSTPAVAPLVQSELRNSTGMTADGNGIVRSVANQYEVCFKCHAGSANKPQNSDYAAFGRTPLRQSQLQLPASERYNAALEFGSAISRHNVTSAKSVYNSPSLRSVALDINGVPTTRSLSSGYLYCTDCHTSDQSRADGGAGPSGPHGSKYQHLLERRYEANLAPAAPGTSTNMIQYTGGLGGPYAMCDKCHDVNGLVTGSNDQVFKKHKDHVVSGGISCSSCHGSHGTPGGDVSHHGGLIDLDSSMATYLDGTPLTGVPAATLVDPLINTDPSKRTCNLVCHGHTHDNKSYQ